MNASTESCGCHGEPARAQTDPAYRRALLTVVVLNLGFGVAELFGGFIAGVAMPGMRPGADDGAGLGPGSGPVTAVGGVPGGTGRSMGELNLT